MSQTPKTTNEEQAIGPYVAGWHATMKLLEEGHSFSGRERNCAFLNCQPGSSRFANVSAVMGLDFPDDGRAAAFVDWDHDGDLDLWLHNRTGPRLRLMLNQFVSPNNPAQNNFVAFKLQGNTSNRDAIGARVEVRLKNQSTAKLVQTLYAGDGFVSQSSKWLHFGLGPHAQIDQVMVHWPSGRTERFTEVYPDTRYLIVEGLGKTIWSRPTQARKLAPSTQPLPTRPSVTGIYFSGRLPMPILRKMSWDASSATVIEPGPQARLICFWASWCQPCVGELRELTKHEKRLREAGLDVLALSVDGLDEAQATGPQDAQQLLRKLNFPFTTARATPELLDKLDVVQQVALIRHPPFGIPTSFLVDPEGQLVAIYRGPVDIEVLLEDVANIDATRLRRRDLAVPFSGRWISEPKRLLMGAVADLYREPGYLEDYIRFGELELTIKEKNRRLARSDQERQEIDREYAQMHYDLGRTLQSEGQLEAAIEHYEQALEIQTEDAVVHFDLGVALLSTRDTVRATEHFRRAVELQPHRADMRINVGAALAAQGQVEEALRHFRHAVELEPDHVQGLMNLAASLKLQGHLRDAADQYRHLLAIHPDHPVAHARLARVLLALNEPAEAVVHLEHTIRLQSSDTASVALLAWLYATCPAEEVRNGTRALELGRRLGALTGNEDPRVLNILAAAYAEQGDFSRAARHAADALEKLGSAPSPLSDAIRGRLQLYQAGKPYRTTP